MDNLVLFGISLGGIILGSVKLLIDEEVVSEKTGNFLRAGLAAAGFVLIAYAPDIAVAWPPFEQLATVGFGALGMFLGVLGYGNVAGSVVARLAGRG